ncbi:MAG: TlpA family protein disulfide reductase [Elioraea sp.]|nr:TlpA family protein disulfide reductase [Elioraea sp.]
MAIGPEMSRRLAVRGLACSAIALAAGQARAGRGQLEVRGRRAALAPAEFFTGAGERRTIADFRRRGLVINLWATWCPPCVEEMPALDRLAELVARHDIEVLALSQDRGGAPVVQGFYDRHALRNLAVWLDPRGAAARAWGVRGLPTTLIVDRVGLEAARLEGVAAWDTPDMVGQIRRLVEPLEPASAAT